jgi:DNA end-binding protein Ku
MNNPRKAASTRKQVAPSAHETGHEGERAPHAIWTGSVGFGLVQIPMSIHAREQTNDLSFHQVDRRDGALIGYERVNKDTHKPVPWADVAKGYEIQKGQFVVVTDDDFERANVEASRTIEIQDFVDVETIPPEFFERPYVLLPDKRGKKAYGVLREALAKKKLAAIALVVIRTRQHLCAVLAEGEVLALELLRFAHELKSVREAAGRLLEGGSSTATPKETALAEQLIDSMVVAWDPAKYKDTYRDELLAAIRQKARTGSIEPRRVPAARHAGVIDLAQLLQRSVAKARKTAGRQRKRRAA